jgi:outer membrane protein OmpA-like peptidoglycan-associated protein
LIGIKDFLLLNAEIKIEIQGHINNEGESDRSSKRLSKKRAKKIRNFFTACGVNRNRLTVKAFSNQFPIYPNPKNEKESQANRRVEIKIL